MFDSFYEGFLNQLALIKVTDIIDVFIVTFVIYKALKFIRDTRTVHLLKGVIVLVVSMQVSQFLKLHTVHYLLSNALQLGLIAIIIVFQPELRRALEQLGRTTMGQWFSFEERTDDDIEKEKIIKEVKESCTNMSKSRIGALIVMEQDNNLDEYISTGIEIDATISNQLLINIFEHNTPLHDGAVIVRGNRVVSATCYLPLSDNLSLSKDLGTRHRAGVGISEVSDSLTIIVSEETGKISVAYEGELERNLDAEGLKNRMQQILSPGAVETNKEKRKWKGRNRTKK